MRRYLKWIWYSLPLLHIPCELLSRVKIRKCLREKGLKKLNFGAGPYKLKGWINADITPSAEVYIDARKRMPFPDDCLDAIFSEHFVEHLSYIDAKKWIGESHRCLKQGGVFRCATPGLNQLIKFYTNNINHKSVDYRKRYNSYKHNNKNKACATAGMLFFKCISIRNVNLLA